MYDIQHMHIAYSNKSSKPLKPSPRILKRVHNYEKILFL